jgi:acyl carrier protein
MTHQTVTKEQIVDFVLGKVSARTKTPLDQLTGETQLASVGVDSLNSVLICGYLEDKYEIEIEPMIMFEYKTANQVAEALLEMLSEV